MSRPTKLAGLRWSVGVESISQQCLALPMARGWHLLVNSTVRMLEKGRWEIKESWCQRTSAVEQGALVS